MEVRPNLNKGKVSIIVPIYNAESFLKDCFLSIESQTFTNFEVICVNDGSTDDSLSICKDFAAKDSRFKVYSQENQGVSAARNKALSYTNGEFVVFVDSDDMIERHFLENLLKQSKNGQFAVCSYAREYGQLTTEGHKLTRYSSKSFIHHILNESIEHPNICMMLFKNSIIQMQHLDFTVGCVRNEDTEFYMKYIVHEKEVVVSDYKGYFYRNNADSAVHIFNKKSLTFIEADQRISDMLISKGFVNKENRIVAASVQYFIYQTAKQNNKDLYYYIHELYPVKSLMKKMCYFPRLSRKGVAWCYLLFGKNMFFRLLSAKPKL